MMNILQTVRGRIGGFREKKDACCSRGRESMLKERGSKRRKKGSKK